MSTQVYSDTAPPVEKLRHLAFEITAEALSAMENWPAMNSAQHVKTNQKKRDLVAMRTEAIQVAAMALRFAAEVCNEERGRK